MSREKLTRVQKYNTEIIKNIETEKNDNGEEIEEPKHHSFPSKLFFSSLIILLIIGTYATLIEPYYISIKEYKIEHSTLPLSMNGLKIIHFSDIHYGNSINKKQLDKIVKKINDLKPDIIIFTGDLISKDIEIDSKIQEEIIDSLSKLECTLHKYAIYGDEDNEIYAYIMNNTDFTLLDNTSSLLYYKDSLPIVITGIGPKEKQDYNTINTAVDNTDIIGFYQIVLIHEPDPVDNFLNYYPELVFAGHTLGGNIKIPFIKPLFLPENGTKYYEDYYDFKTSELYISTGLGTSSLNLRLNNPPSINLYRLYSSK